MFRRGVALVLILLSLSVQGRELFECAAYSGALQSSCCCVDLSGCAQATSQSCKVAANSGPCCKVVLKETAVVSNTEFTSHHQYDGFQPALPAAISHTVHSPLRILSATQLRQVPVQGPGTLTYLTTARLRL